MNYGLRKLADQILVQLAGSNALHYEILILVLAHKTLHLNKVEFVKFHNRATFWNFRPQVIKDQSFKFKLNH